MGRGSPLGCTVDQEGKKEMKNTHVQKRMVEGGSHNAMWLVRRWRRVAGGTGDCGESTGLDLKPSGVRKHVA